MIIGDKIYVSDSIGEVIILDIQENYLVLFRLDASQFVKANDYEVKYDKLIWNGGEYYSNLTELIKSLKV